MGFWVAITMNGRGTGCGSPSTVTWRSSMTSSSADWVFGEARLISSASTMLANTGPGRNSNSLVAWLKIVTPVTSDGQQVGRELDAPPRAVDRLAAIALASVVLPMPGTSSISRWPSANRQVSARLDRLGLALEDRLDVGCHRVEPVGEPGGVALVDTGLGVRVTQAGLWAGRVGVGGVVTGLPSTGVCPSQAAELGAVGRIGEQRRAAGGLDHADGEAVVEVRAQAVDGDGGRATGGHRAHGADGAVVGTGAAQEHDVGAGAAVGQAHPTGSGLTQRVEGQKPCKIE